MNIDEIEAKYLAATPGVWEYNVEHGKPYPRHSIDSPDLSVAYVYEGPDAAFIAAAHNAMPELIAAWREREALRKLLPVADKLCDATAALVERCEKEAKP